MVKSNFISSEDLNYTRLMLLRMVEEMTAKQTKDEINIDDITNEEDKQVFAAFLTITKISSDWHLITNMVKMTIENAAQNEKFDGLLDVLALRHGMSFNEREDLEALNNSFIDDSLVERVEKLYPSHRKSRVDWKRR